METGAAWVFIIFFFIACLVLVNLRRKLIALLEKKVASLEEANSDLKAINKGLLSDMIKKAMDRAEQQAVERAVDSLLDKSGVLPAKNDGR